MKSEAISSGSTTTEIAGPSEDDVRGFISGILTAVMFGLGIVNFFAALTAFSAVRISINLASNSTPFTRFDDGFYLYVALQLIKACCYLAVVFMCSVVAIVAQLLRLRR